MKGSEEYGLVAVGGGSPPGSLAEGGRQGALPVGKDVEESGDGSGEGPGEEEEDENRSDGDGEGVEQGESRRRGVADRCLEGAGDGEGYAEVSPRDGAQGIGRVGSDGELPPLSPTRPTIFPKSGREAIAESAISEKQKKSRGENQSGDDATNPALHTLSSLSDTITSSTQPHDIDRRTQLTKSPIHRARSSSRGGLHQSSNGRALESLQGLRSQQVRSSVGSGADLSAAIHILGREMAQQQVGQLMEATAVPSASSRRKDSSDSFLAVSPHSGRRRAPEKKPERENRIGSDATKIKPADRPRLGMPRNVEEVEGEDSPSSSSRSLASSSSEGSPGRNRRFQPVRRPPLGMDDGEAEGSSDIESDGGSDGESNDESVPTTRRHELSKTGDNGAESLGMTSGVFPESPKARLASRTSEDHFPESSQVRMSDERKRSSDSSPSKYRRRDREASGSETKKVVRRKRISHSGRSPPRPRASSERSDKGEEAGRAAGRRSHSPQASSPMRSKKKKKSVEEKEKKRKVKKASEKKKGAEKDKAVGPEVSRLPSYLLRDLKNYEAGSASRSGSLPRSQTPPNREPLAHAESEPAGPSDRKEADTSRLDGAEVSRPRSSQRTANFPVSKETSYLAKVEQRQGALEKEDWMIKHTKDTGQLEEQTDAPSARREVTSPKGIREGQGGSRESRLVATDSVSAREGGAMGDPSYEGKNLEVSGKALMVAASERNIGSAKTSALQSGPGRGLGDERGRMLTAASSVVRDSPTAAVGGTTSHLDAGARLRTDSADEKGQAVLSDDRADSLQLQGERSTRRRTNAAALPQGNSRGSSLPIIESPRVSTKSTTKSSRTSLGDESTPKKQKHRASSPSGTVGVRRQTAKSIGTRSGASDGSHSARGARATSVSGTGSPHSAAKKSKKGSDGTKGKKKKSSLALSQHDAESMKGETSGKESNIGIDIPTSPSRMSEETEREPNFQESIHGDSKVPKSPVVQTPRLRDLPISATRNLLQEASLRTVSIKEIPKPPVAEKINSKTWITTPPLYEGDKVDLTVRKLRAARDAFSCIDLRTTKEWLEDAFDLVDENVDDAFPCDCVQVVPQFFDDIVDDEIGGQEAPQQPSLAEVPGAIEGMKIKRMAQKVIKKPDYCTDDDEQKEIQLFFMHLGLKEPDAEFKQYRWRKMREKFSKLLNDPYVVVKVTPLPFKSDARFWQHLRAPTTGEQLWNYLKSITSASSLPFASCVSPGDGYTCCDGGACPCQTQIQRSGPRQRIDLPYDQVMEQIFMEARAVQKSIKAPTDPLNPLLFGLVQSAAGGIRGITHSYPPYNTRNPHFNVYRDAPECLEPTRWTAIVDDTRGHSHCDQKDANRGNVAGGGNSSESRLKKTKGDGEDFPCIKFVEKTKSEHARSPLREGRRPIISSIPLQFVTTGRLLDELLRGQEKENETSKQAPEMTARESVVVGKEEAVMEESKGGDADDDRGGGVRGEKITNEKGISASKGSTRTENPKKARSQAKKQSKGPNESRHRKTAFEKHSPTLLKAEDQRGRAGSFVGITAKSSLPVISDTISGRKATVAINTGKGSKKKSLAPRKSKVEKLASAFDRIVNSVRELRRSKGMSGADTLNEGDGPVSARGGRMRTGIGAIERSS